MGVKVCNASCGIRACTRCCVSAESDAIAIFDATASAARRSFNAGAATTWPATSCRRRAAAEYTGLAPGAAAGRAFIATDAGANAGHARWNSAATGSERAPDRSWATTRATGWSDGRNCSSGPAGRPSTGSAELSSGGATFAERRARWCRRIRSDAADPERGGCARASEQQRH